MRIKKKLPRKGSFFYAITLRFLAQKQLELKKKYFNHCQINQNLQLIEAH